MFRNKNRRRAASNPPLHGSNASASATTAAASAFLKSSASTASLSSAAAAAALRARPTSPTSVADVQTKRTIRRAGSTSSVGSMGSGPPGSQLQRRGSSGSMSERSFREPSPARSPSRSSQPLPSDDAPPVPAIPKNLPSHRRSASLQPSPMRVASPPPASGGRGSSLGAQSRRSSQRTSLSSVQELPGIERPASRGSVNFSLPTSSRSPSPNPQWLLTSSLQSARPPVIVSPTNQNLVYDPNTRSFLPEYEILAIEQRIRNATNQPVKKKKRLAPKQATGTHLADGTVGGRPRGTAVDAMETKLKAPSEPVEQPAALPEQIREPSPTSIPVAEPPKRRRRMKMVMVSDSDSDGDMASHDPMSSDTDTDVMAQPRTYTPRPTAALSKKPSIVREEREREEEEEEALKSKARTSLIPEDTSALSSRNTSPSPVRTPIPVKPNGRDQSSSPVPITQVQNHVRSDDQCPPVIETNGIGKPSTAPSKPRSDRVQSVSPARNAHFAHEPKNLVIRHQPPLRSISPRKSALKNTNFRDSSPSADPTGADNQNGSEASDELSVPRKKANRVSFDERNVVVGEAASSTPSGSPIVQSPQAAKKHWYSINRGKRKDNGVLDVEDDEVMKPRPALPSFGSVREKKAQREVQERPLVKPTTPQEYAPEPSPPLFSTASEATEYPTALSNDHVAGAILSQDAATKNTANISKSREPLPPQVTSVEGNGYLSDSSSVCSVEGVSKGQGTNDTSHDEGTPEADQHDDTQRDSIQPAISSVHTKGQPKSQVNSASMPRVSAVPLPPLVTVTSPPNEWPDIPGGWNHFNSESDGEAKVDKNHSAVEKNAVPATPASVGVAEPTPEISQPGSPVLGNIAAENSQSPTSQFDTEASEESDDNSIYSDAAEDLSDLEGDGFLSLDAIVDSPVRPTPQVGVAITAPESPTSKATKQRAYRLAATTAEPDSEAGWKKTQEYWKGLSSEKKRQLELEAMGERDDSESEAEVKLAPKPKKNTATTKLANGAGSEDSEKHRSMRDTKRSYMISPGTKAETSHTIPTEPADTHMRKSMRAQGGTRSSLRGSSEYVDQGGALQKRHRPKSNLPPELQADPATIDALVKKLSAERAIAASATSRPMAAPSAPTLRRQGSADSESSFKRSRQTNTAEIPTFRHSMRGIRDESAGERRQSPAGTRRFSLRSLSPASSNFRQPMSPPPSQMRSSMRSSVGPAPTLRGNNPPSGGKSAFRIPGFGRSAPAKQATKQKSRPMHTSRFADSSDEEDNQPAFRSRFVESSDEDDEPLPRRTAAMRSSAPVRGIPQRHSVDVESSDLPDSDDEAPIPIQNRAQNGVIAKPQPQSGTAKQSNGNTTLASGSLRRSGSGRGAINPTISSTRPDKANRSSIMGILRRKKPDPSSKVRKSDAESAARRDTPLERSRSDLAIVRSGSMSPRLQKKNPHAPARSQSAGGSWPLTGNGEGRPFSGDSDGIATTITGGSQDARPGMGSRQSTAASKMTGAGDINGVDVVSGTRKKKKFGALRRMFKLDE